MSTREEHAPPGPSRVRTCALLVALCVLGHLPVLTGSWVWEDKDVVLRRAAPHSVRAAMAGLVRYRPWRALPGRRCGPGRCET